MLDSETLFQRLSLDESLRRTFAVYRSGFLVFTKIAASMLVVMTLLWSILLPILLSALGVNGQDFSDPYFLSEHLKEYYVINFAYIAASQVIGAVAAGTMIKAIADFYLGRDPDLLACLKLGWKKSLTVMFASFLVMLGVMVGIVLFFFPGLYLAVAWFVVTPAIVVEKYGVFGSLGRSRSLVSGSWCYVFCTFLIVYLIMFAATFVWNLAFVTVLNKHNALTTIIGYLISNVPAIFMIPILGITQTVMYFNLRVEKEGLDTDLLASDLGERGGDVSYRQVSLMEMMEGEDKAKAMSSATDAV